MKTVEQIVDAISMHGCRSDWIDALHQYGEQVAERVTDGDCAIAEHFLVRGTALAITRAIRAAMAKEREG